MSEIPDDIRAKAREVADMLWLTTFEKSHAANVFAQALFSERLAAEKRGEEEERDRCAKIADGRGRAVIWTPQEIAAAIRGS